MNIKLKKYSNKYQEKWNQWFAGVTDGDGYFYINTKEKSISYEITTHVSDARVVYDIKNKLKGGTVRLRSGSKSIRYRVKAKNIIIDIINILNGKLYNQVRLAQFEECCRLLNILPFSTPFNVEKNNSYLSGLIDSDGSFAISVAKSSAEDSQISGVEGRTIRLINAKGYNQISLKITSVDATYLYMIQRSYGLGIVYVEKANLFKKRPLAKYHWIIKSYEAFLRLYDYCKKNPLKSVKMHRMRLVLLYFKYKQLGYHLKPVDTLEFKIWVKFCKSWFKYAY
nr:putative LAGLIDADG homing endonuclease [Haematococcus lacustris]